jgi:hypothetical protein
VNQNLVDLIESLGRAARSPILGVDGSRFVGAKRIVHSLIRVTSRGPESDPDIGSGPITAGGAVMNRDRDRILAASLAIAIGESLRLEAIRVSRITPARIRGEL